MNNFSGKRVAVIGAGRSGCAAAGALLRRGAQVALYDRKPSAELTLALPLAAQGVALHAETEAPPNLQGYDLVIVSPGVPPSHPIFALAEQVNAPLWSEIELAYHISPAPIIAITGTNGKTTTTMLIHHLLRTMGLKARLCGNIAGTEDDLTLTEAAEAAAPDEWLVAEVSSFQLLHTHAFRPRIAVITNIREDHLDYHGSWEAYALAKAKILANLGAGDWAVLNGEDEGIQRMLQLISSSFRFYDAGEREGAGGSASPTLWERGQGCEGKPSIIFFTTAHPVVQLNDGVLNLAEVPMPALRGKHNLENALAAAHVAALLGGTVQPLREAFATFKGVPHRMEFVGEWAGVRYINNSMCTNADALESSLRATPKPCLVIAGGVDKNDSIQQIAESLARHARFALLIGRDGQAIGDALTRLGYLSWEYAATLEDAVKQAQAQARAGETVILAPGCASFDQFRNFAHRGEEFKRLVKEVNG
ncbi:MAG: UDP-N-acetylmuramoylalanine--D-glutamate ligase [Fimbriimonadales bacterium]|nr:MAG: UDP-N-acetylmuramoylalanine--D-glutamate ligase [Fimbriimonadales bacterium]